MRQFIRCFFGFMLLLFASTIVVDRAVADEPESMTEVCEADMQAAIVQPAEMSPGLLPANTKARCWAFTLQPHFVTIAPKPTVRFDQRE